MISALLVLMTALARLGPIMPLPPAPAALAADTLAPVRLPDVIADAPPNSVRIISVPVPTEYRIRGVRYLLEVLGGFDVLGPRSGELQPGDGRTLAFAFMVPAAALAGPTPVGLLHLDCINVDCPASVVPIYIDVSRQPGLQVTAERSMVGGMPGRRIHASAVVRNSGNAALDVIMEAQAPPTWQHTVTDAPSFRLEPGMSRVVHLEVRIPHDNIAGMFRLTVTARAGDLAQTSSYHVYLEPGLGSDSGTGEPSLAVAAGAVVEADGTTTPALSTNLDGEIMPGVRVNAGAGMIVGDRLSSSAGTGLSRIGMYRTRPRLHMHARTWDAGVGAVGTGGPGRRDMGLLRSMTGTGVRGRYDGEHFSTFLFAAAQPSGDGHSIVAEAGTVAGPLHLTGSGVLVRENRFRLLEMRAAMARADLPWQGGAATLHGGFIESNTAVGPAFGGRLAHTTRTWSLVSFATHVPGGSQSYGRAESEVGLQGHRRLTSWLSLGASGSRSDDTQAEQRYSTSGATAAASLQVPRLGSVRIGAELREWTWDVGVASSAHEQRGATVSWTRTLGSANVRLDVNRSQVSRSSSIGSDLAVTTESWRTHVSGGASGPLRGAYWDLFLSVDMADALLGLPREQYASRAALQNFTLIPGRLVGHVGAQGQYLSSTDVLQLSQFAGIGLALGRDHTLTIEFTRDNFHGSNGRPRNIVASKLERRMRVPAVERRGGDGVVFADLNGNGVRDPGEPGHEGVVLMAGDRPLATSDSRGRFFLAGTDPSVVVIDPRSLAPGWMAAPRGERTGKVELAVVQTQQVEVTVRVENGPGVDTERLPRSFLVILTDGNGRVWSAMTDDEGRVRFDSLRPGRYTVSADVSRLSVPLLLPNVLPSINVSGGSAPVGVELLLSPRPIRMIVPGNVRTISSRLPPQPPDHD